MIIIFILISVASANINIDVINGNKTNEVIIKCDGFESNIIGKEDLKLFKISLIKLKSVLKSYYGKKPSEIYLKGPTPWEDLYKKYHWEPVKRILKIKSAKLKTANKKQVIVLAHEFENSSNNTIKVNTGISQTVENSLTRTWSKNHEFEISQDIEYDLNVLFAKASGTTGISYRNIWGKSEDKSESITIGSTTSVETELKPNQGARAILSANRGFLELEIRYAMFLRGNIAINFEKAYKGHHFWGPSIEDVMKHGGISNDLETVENIKLGFYCDAVLKVFDKDTGLPL